MELTTFLGALAVTAFLVRLLPQPVRLLRTGVPDGVSPLMTLNMGLTELAWLAYGLAAGLLPIWAVSLPAAPLAFWTAWLLRRRMRAVDVVGAALWFAVIVGAWWVGALGAVLGISVVVQYGPQVVTALRESELDGISPATWWLALVDAASWGAYGLAVGDPALVGYTLTLSAFATIILVRIRQTGRAGVGLELATDLPGTPGLAAAPEPA